MFRNLAFITLLSIGIVSCQKEISAEFNGNNGAGNNGGSTGGSNSGGSISGTWKLDHLLIQGRVVSSMTGLGMDTRIETNMGYITKDNTGTISFNNGKAETKNLGYSADTTMVVYTYEGGILLDSMEMPFQAPYISSSTKADYKLIGSDSISFTGGSPLVMSNGTTTSTSPGGLKYNVSGNKLTLSFQFARDSTGFDSGLSMKMHQTGKGAMYFTKQ